jgi:hypothetical protein
MVSSLGREFSTASSSKEANNVLVSPAMGGSGRLVDDSVMVKDFRWPIIGCGIQVHDFMVQREKPLQFTVRFWMYRSICVLIIL